MDRDLRFPPFILLPELLFVSGGILIFYKNKKTRGTKGLQKVRLGWRRRGSGTLCLCHLPSKRDDFFFFFFMERLVPNSSA